MLSGALHDAKGVSTIWCGQFKGNTGPGAAMQTHHSPVLLLLATSSSGQASVMEAREPHCIAAGVEALLGAEPAAAAVSVTLIA